MDQSKTGRFIAERRKAQGLTQRQLAEALELSDKTISKWECGNGLPEVSLMLPLCSLLDISVNDMLSGERVSQLEYKQKAEANMIDLLKDQQENKKRFALSIITGIITIIAMLALVCLAAFLDLPTVGRVGLIVFALITAVFGIAGAAMLDRESGAFECPHCLTLFRPSMSQYTKGYHTFTKRRLTCPECGQTSLCRHRITR